MEWSTETCSQTILNAKNKIYINNDELTNVIIENDYGNNRIMFPDRDVDSSENDIFLSTLKKVHEQQSFSKQADAELYLKKKRKQLADKLSQAYYFYESKSYMKALDCFEEAIRMIENDCYPDEYQLMPDDIYAIKYCIALCNLRRMEYGSLQSAVSQLKHLIEDKNFGNKWPVLYLSLAEVHLALKHHELCTNVLKSGLCVLSNFNSAVSPNWPGTNNNVIIELDSSQLQHKMNELLKEATLPNVPDAYCCYSSCHLVGNSQKAIYFDSPSFDGYSILCCTENCKFYYHRQCWRRYTREVRKNGKDAINGPCPTPNCTGYLNSFQIFDERGKLKASKESATQLNVNVDEDNSSVCSINSKKEYICRPDNIFYKNHASKCSEDVAKSESELSNQTLNVDVPEFLPGQKYKLDSCTNSENSFKIGISQTEKLITNTTTTQTCNKTNEVSIQVSRKSSNKSIQTIDKYKTDEIKLLKTHIESLNSSLFETEHNYNLLLNEKKCPCCKRLEIKTQNVAVQIDVNQKDNIEKMLSLKTELDQYKTKSIQLQNQLEEVNKELSKVKYLCDKQLKEKEHSIQELNNKFSTLQLLNGELNKQNSEKDNLVDRLRKNFYQEQHFSRSVYNHFLTTYTDKCNRILWELNQIEPLLNPHTCPTISEVKTAQSNWLRSQSYTVQFTQCINKYYDDQLTNYWYADSKEIRSSVQRPNSVLPHEPPNIFMHYFRLLLQDNFRLHENLQRMNWSLRKNVPPPVLSPSRPHRPPLLGHYPMPPFQPPIINNPNERFKINEKLIQNQNFQQNLDKSKSSYSAKVEEFARQECKTEKFDCNTDLNVYKEDPCLDDEINKSDFDHNFKEKNNYCLNSENFIEMSNEEVNSSIHSQKLFEEHKDNFLDEIQNRNVNSVSENEIIDDTSFPKSQCVDKELTENVCKMNFHDECYISEHSSHNHSEVEYNEEIDRLSEVSKKGDSDIDRENFSCGSGQDTNANEGDYKTDLKTEVNKQFKSQSQMTIAMNKIREKFFPDVPMDTYLEAIAVLRSKKGKLSGYSMKVIREELHKILYETRKHSERGDSESIKSNKQVWATVGLPEWNREQADINCPICFEFMSQEGTSELTCGHKYHSSCIKIWLDSNSICPICRLYTTNEEDFPPLK